MEERERKRDTVRKREIKRKIEKEAKEKRREIEKEAKEKSRKNDKNRKRPQKSFVKII